MKSPFFNSVNVILKATVPFEDVDAFSNELKDVVDRYRLHAATLEQSELVTPEEDYD